MKSSIKIAAISFFVIVFIFITLQISIETTYFINFINSYIIDLFIIFLFINSIALAILLFKAKQLNNEDVDINLSSRTEQIMSAMDYEVELIKTQLALFCISIIYLIFCNATFLESHHECILFINLCIVLFFVYETTNLYNSVKCVFDIR